MYLLDYIYIIFSRQRLIVPLGNPCQPEDYFGKLNFNFVTNVYFDFHTADFCSFLCASFGRINNFILLVIMTLHLPGVGI